MSQLNYNATPYMTNSLYLMYRALPVELESIEVRNTITKDEWKQSCHDAYALNKFCCAACGVHSSEAAFKTHLECHEIYKMQPAQRVWQYVDNIALCHTCHNFIHLKQLRERYNSGKISKEKFNYINDFGTWLLNGISRTKVSDDGLFNYYANRDNPVNKWGVEYKGTTLRL